MWNIFRSREWNLRRECKAIYEKHINFLYWFFTVRCNLSEEECHTVLRKAEKELIENIEELHGKSSKEQGEWFLKNTYRIAKDMYDKVSGVQRDV